MEDFKFTIQYDGRKPLECNTYFIQEDVLRMKMGLEPHMEDNHIKEDFYEVRT